MLNIHEFLKYTGGLHDAVIIKINWSISDKRLEIVIEDIECNYEGLPEYKGPTAGKVLLENVLISKIDLELENDQLNVYDFAISSSSDERFKFKVIFWPNGRLEGTSSEPTIALL